MKQFITLFILSLLTTTFLISQNNSRQIHQSFKAYDEAIPQEKLYLHTDRSLYNPGETIWFKAYLTDVAHLPSEVSPIVYAQLLNPKGSKEKEINLVQKNGAFYADFQLNANAPGGIYKIRAYTTWMKNQGDRFFFEKEITVQGVVLPNLLMKLDFAKDAYGPGDMVTAELDVRSLDDMPLANKNFSATISLAGTKIKDVSARTDKEGKADITFSLPENLDTSDGLINVKLPYEGSTESISRSIPIVLNDIDLQFFAEGGDLIYGTKNKVAFKAIDEFGKAADISGVVLDKSGKEVASFESYHKGMGAFVFQPQKNMDYSIKITRPEGIDKKYELPKILDNALGMRMLEQEKDKLHLSIYSPKKQETYIAGFIGGKLQQVFPISLEAGDNKVNIPTKEMTVGILQLTLFDQSLKAQSERLIFVNKHRKIKVDISTDKEKYLPREDVNATISITDDKGNGIPGNFSLAVVDDQIHTFADDKQDNILSYLLMSSELKGEVEEPNFYFDDKEEKADKAIDFVMMTHGWRRFKWRDVLEFNKNNISQFVRYQPEVLIAKGRLIINNKPVTGARIWTKDHSQFARTDRNGYFTFKNVSLPLQVETKHRGLKTYATIQKYFVEKNKIKSVASKNIIYANGIYRGTVIDANGEALIGASITVKGTNRGTVTDFNGAYQIEVQPGDVLVVTYTGYSSYEITVGDKQPVALAEKKEEVLLDDFNDEVAAVEIEERVVELDDVLAGKVAGIAVADAKANAKKDRMERGAKQRKKRVANMPGAVVMQEGQLLQDVVVTAAPAFLIRADASASVAVVDASKIQSVPPNGSSYHFETERGFKSSYLYINPLGGSNVSFYNSREFYAPRYNANTRKNANGTDKRKTLHWLPNIKMDKTGSYQFSYSNSDEVSTYRFILEGISEKGQVIRHESTYFTQELLAMDGKMPVAVTHGDTLMIPVSIKNNSDEVLEGVFLPCNAMGFMAQDHKTNTAASIPAGKNHTEYYTFVIDKKVKGKQGIFFQFQSAKGTEQIAYNIDINPKGFPRKASFSSKELQRTFTFNIDDYLDNSLEGTIGIYPNIMEELFSGAESILREPHGCFEQTSSSNYPNIMALQYMEATKKTDAAIKEKATRLLSKGYARLAGYECSNGGFEWWGNDPAHETLTAYGLLQFVDMKKVYKGVDEAMIDRTAKWLMDRRNGKGGFNQRGNGLDRFRGSSPLVGDAYIAFALTEAGYTDIEKEVNHITKEALQTKDAYLLALTAISNFNINNKVKAYECLDAIKGRVDFDGDKLVVNETVTRSYGNNRLTEAAALFARGIMKSEDDKVDTVLLEKVIQFLASRRSGGGFGSTQATVLGLKAMVDYAQFMGTTDKSGRVQVYANGKIAHELKYEKGHRGSIKVDLKPYLKKGENTITVTFDETDTALPYSANVAWTSLTPSSSKNCRVDLETSLASRQVKVGETIRLTATIKNLHDNAIPTPIALIGIPAGLSLQPWQLKEMTDEHVFDYYEIQGNYLIAYFTSMEQAENKVIHLDLKADIPGSYKAPASTAYLYYDKQDKDWDKGTFVKINP